MKDFKEFLNESLVKEGFGDCPPVREWIKALKEYSAEVGGIPVLKDNKINPQWLKKATARGWEYEGNNADCLIWNRLMGEIDPTSLDDIVDWLSENWDDIQIDLADSEEMVSNCMDIFPYFE